LKWSINPTKQIQGAYKKVGPGNLGEMKKVIGGKPGDGPVILWTRRETS
jgi:hypothetical protein